MTKFGEAPALVSEYDDQGNPVSGYCAFCGRPPESNYYCQTGGTVDQNRRALDEWFEQHMKEIHPYLSRPG